MPPQGHRSQLAESSPVRSDDCFEQFDAAFDALATELAWGEVAKEPVVAVAPALAPALALAPVPARPPAEFGPAAGTSRIRDEDLDALDLLAAGRPAAGAGEGADHSAADLERLHEAFDLLDARLARVGGSQPAPAPPSQVPATTSISPVRLAPSPVRTSSKPLTAVAPRQPRPGGRSPVENVLALLDNLTGIRDRLALDPAHAPVAAEAAHDGISAVLADARQLCVDLDLHTASVRSEFAVTTLERGEYQRLGGEIDELVRHIRHDLRSCSIWPIAPSRVWALNLTFGGDVHAAFPSAHRDVAEAGLCFALARYPASVFHMARAAERGLRALATAANAKATASNDERGLDPLIAIIEKRLAHIAASWPRGEARTRALAFFRGSLDEAKGVRQAAQRLAIDATRVIDEHEALTVCTRTRDLFIRLSERISEAQARTLPRREFAR